MRGLAALLLVLSPLPAFASGDSSPATAPMRIPNCEGIALLPADASPEDKRVTCEIPGPMRRQVLEAETRGFRLRRHDLAAWLSTDALKPLHAFQSVAGKQVGWLTREYDNAVEIRYFTEVDGRVFAFASARLADGETTIRDVRVLEPMSPADPRELRLIKARAAAFGAPRLQCTPIVNTVILEEPGFDHVRVYLFSAWNETDAPMGGHSRFLVSEDGERILDTFQQTGSCLNFESASLEKPQGMIFVSDKHAGPPSEMQVFMQRQYNVPIVVQMLADDTVWKLQDGLVHFVPPGDPLYETVHAGDRAANKGDK
jgi:hypothetical protein